MAILKIEQFATTKVSSGISMSCGMSGGLPYFRLGFTEAAQEQFFGARVNTEDQALNLFVSTTPGTEHLMGVRLVGHDRPDALLMASGARGSVFVKVKAWVTVKSKWPAVGLNVVNAEVKGGGISVSLPKWACPEPDRSLTSAKR